LPERGQFSICLQKQKDLSYEQVEAPKPTQYNGWGQRFSEFIMLNNVKFGEYD